MYAEQTLYHDHEASDVRAEKKTAKKLAEERSCI
jgi:hypothetical protein